MRDVDTIRAHVAEPAWTRGATGADTSLPRPSLLPSSHRVSLIAAASYVRCAKVAAAAPSASITESLVNEATALSCLVSAVGHLLEACR